MSKKITAIQTQQHNPDRVSIFLDGQYAFGLDAATAASLRIGRTLNDLEISQLQEADVLAQAYTKAVRFLASRSRSTEEVRRKLREKDFSTAIIDLTITRLEAQGYVNDAEFAHAWVRNRLEFSPRGPTALRTELRGKGIANDIIDTLLSELDTTDSALLAARQKAQSLRGLDPRTFRQKLGTYLLRRGFDYDTVQATTDTLIQELDEDDTTEE